MANNDLVEKWLESDSDSDCSDLPHLEPYEYDVSDRKQQQKLSLFKHHLFLSTDTDTSQSASGSVSEVLQSREIDATSLLQEIFGPNMKIQKRMSIPKKFFGPSQCKGVSVEKFIEHEMKVQHLANCTSLGFRGLTKIVTGGRHPVLLKIVDLICKNSDVK